MPSVCLYFQVHQPYRLRRYSFFDAGGTKSFFDNELNREVMRRVADRCYLPANAALRRAIKAGKGDFKVAFSITGTAIEQMRQWAPDALASFKELVKTGCVDLLGETYYHSLASIYDPDEFRSQVQAHQDLMHEEFRCRPRVFRNTELIYSDAIGQIVADMGFRAVLAEGVDSVVGWRSVNQLYRVFGRDAALFLKNYPLSDDIAFRFHSSGLEEGPLTPSLYAHRLRETAQSDDIVCLFMDYETFGEHHGASTGIVGFLEDLPAELLRHRGWQFLTPSEALGGHRVGSELSCPTETSWADVARDLSAWRGNSMQQSALKKIYAYQPHTEEQRSTWRKLQTSDHFYYMSTKGAGDGAVHSYFSPFESPYDAFISYMNVLRSLNRLIDGISG
jgi:alpha-amylase